MKLDIEITRQPGPVHNGPAHLIREHLRQQRNIHPAKVDTPRTVTNAALSCALGLRWHSLVTALCVPACCTINRGLPKIRAESAVRSRVNQREAVLFLRINVVTELETVNQHSSHHQRDIARRCTAWRSAID